MASCIACDVVDHGNSFFCFLGLMGETVGSSSRVSIHLPQKLLHLPGLLLWPVRHESTFLLRVDGGGRVHVARTIAGTALCVVTP